ncbi:hypothetical protein T484DRAFT_3634866 [Baffinella frigidus]|nr:hypothetical protein T484DRAFT_3634866 [Cryptophyta sp. CCMP2293]
MGFSSLFSMGPGSPFRTLVSPSRSPPKIAHLENKGSPFRALFSSFRSPSRIAHLEQKTPPPTDSPSVAKRQEWPNDKLQQHANRDALFSALPAISAAPHVRKAQSTERHPSTEETARAVHSDIASRHSMEEEPGRRERDAQCSRSLVAAAAPLGKQLKMKELVFEEGATRMALVENTERLRPQGVAPDPPTSLRVVSSEDDTAGETPPQDRRRVHFAVSLSNTRLHDCLPGERPRRISRDSDSDDSLPERRSPRLHDAHVLLHASRRLTQIRQRHGLI